MPEKKPDSRGIKMGGAKPVAIAVALGVGLLLITGGILFGVMATRKKIDSGITAEKILKIIDTGLDTTREIEP